MALSMDAYRELEDIVGPENLSMDPAVLEGYSYYRSVGVVETSGISSGYFLQPEAVVLPGHTKEVQAIVKWCGRSGIKCKSISTGFGPHNAVESEGEIILDMRRMNRILDIDEKNMIAVVEPYVSFAQVQAEAMKRGLNCHIVGAGCQVSALASHTSVGGNATQGISQGHGARNALAMELVLPTGEILQFGSLGSGSGWFSSNGPGPSLRGVVRGMNGAFGALGVFTKCAFRLNPWPGPREIKINGISPYHETEVPPLFEYHVLEWPTWEKCADALLKIGEARIAFAIHKTSGPGSHGSIVTGCNNEYYEKLQAGEMNMPRVSWAVVLYANSQKEHDYGVKVLDKILEETEGKILPVGEDPVFKKRDFLNMIKTCFVPRLAYRVTGSFSVDGITGIDSIDNMVLANKLDDIHRDKFAEKGIIFNDGSNNSWAAPFDDCHYGLSECGQQYDPMDDESCKGLEEMVQEGTKICLTTPIPISAMASGGLAELLGPMCCDFHLWMQKIKKTFDPDRVFDSLSYVPGNDA